MVRLIHINLPLIKNVNKGKGTIDEKSGVSNTPKGIKCPKALRFFLQPLANTSYM